MSSVSPKVMRTRVASGASLVGAGFVPGDVCGCASGVGGGSASSCPQADSATAAKTASAAIRRGITWSSRSAGGVAAVDGERDAHDEARAGAAQPQDGRGDLVGASEPADRLIRDGVLDRSSSPLAIMSATIGVSMVPGQTALMRTPRGAYSRAALLVRPITPCFDAW